MKASFGWRGESSFPRPETTADATTIRRAETVTMKVTCGTGNVCARSFTSASVPENIAKEQTTISAALRLDRGTLAPIVDDLKSAGIEAAEMGLDASLQIFKPDRKNPVDHGGGDQHLDMAELRLALGAGKIHDFPDTDDRYQRGILQHG